MLHGHKGVFSALEHDFNNCNNNDIKMLHFHPLYPQTCTYSAASLLSWAPASWNAGAATSQWEQCHSSDTYRCSGWTDKPNCGWGYRSPRCALEDRNACQHSISCALSTSHVLSFSTLVLRVSTSDLVLTINLGRRTCYFPHFIAEEPKIQRW